MVLMLVYNAFIKNVLPSVRWSVLQWGRGQSIHGVTHPHGEGSPLELISRQIWFFYVLSKYKHFYHRKFEICRPNSSSIRRRLPRYLNFSSLVESVAKFSRRQQLWHWWMRVVRWVQDTHWAKLSKTLGEKKEIVDFVVLFNDSRLL